MKVAILKKFALAAGVAALLGVVGQASAAPQFTFDSSGTGKTSGSTTFVADQFNGNSSELITFASTPTGENSAQGYLFFSNATLANSVQPVKGFGTLGTYGLYLTFNLTNHLIQQNAAGNTYQLDSLSFNFYIDTNNDTTFQTPVAATGTSAIRNGNFGDDVQIASGNLIPGSSNVANINGQGPGASVGLTSTETFMNVNQQYFTLPNPFYAIAFDSFTNNGGAYTQSADGQFGAINNANGNVTFTNVPEPGTVALFGIAAAALGLSSRRRKS